MQAVGGVAGEARKLLEAALISAIVLTLLFIPQLFTERWYGPMNQAFLPSGGFFEIEGNPAFIFSGEMHYFRIPKGLWYDRLLKAKRAGLNAVASYIAWNWHEPREGLVLFGDEGAGGFYESSAFSRNLEDYLRAVWGVGLYFIARPGPYICSEWDSGGHPNWLYAKNPILRSLDQVYISQAERWYGTVLPILAKYSVSRGGPLIMVQVENEYFWGDAPYIVRLYEIAKRYAGDLPIVTNEDWHVEGTPVINTIDDYPSPWDISGFDNKVRSYMRTQPGMPKMHMELEGGWFSTFGGPLPTNRGSFPAAWTETLVKTTIGLGVNAVNIYMFHGGTNPGYYTGKYITTTYDYEAAISEWGYLRDRYYALKRVALFTTTFNDLLVSTKPAEGFVQTSEADVDVFTRVGEGGGVLAVLRNMGDQPRSLKLKYGGEIYPYAGSIRIPAKYAKFLVLNYTVPGTPFRIVYTASEPLLKVGAGTDTLFIVYGDAGEEGGLAVASEYPISVSYTRGVKVELRGEKTAVIALTHGDADSIAVLSSGGFTLSIVGTSRERAGRTWLIDDFGEPLVLVSNVYFAGRASMSGRRLALELELDERSGGAALLYYPKALESVTVDGAEIAVARVYGNLYELTLHVPSRKGPAVTQAGWVARAEEEFVKGSPLAPQTPLEFAGILDNGYATYTIRFNSSKLPEDRHLYVSYFNDFATVLLNGVPLASAYYSIETDASKALKQGSNELVVLLESIGHPNDGLVHVPNGIVGGIYLGKVREEELKGWMRVKLSLPYGRDFSITQFLHEPKTVIDALNDPNLEQKAEKVDTIDGGGLYLKRFTIERLEGRYILTFTSRAMLFVNKRYLGVYLGPTDITDYLREGENEIAIAWDWLPRGNPVLNVYEVKIEGEWRAAAGTKGLAEGWFKEELDARGWSEATLPLELKGSEGKVVWLRGRFNVSLGERAVAPLRLRVSAKGVRMLIYFNGQFVGRFVPEGPQTEFYVPEPLVKSGENTVAIMVHVVSGDARVDSIALEPYYVHPTAELEVAEAG